MTKIDLATVVVSQSDFASFLGIDDRSVRRLTTEGRFVKAPGRGKYWLQKSNAEYVAHLQNVAGNKGLSASSELATAKAREAKARADKVELTNCRMRKELVEVAVVAAEWTTVAAATRKRILAVPSRLRSDGMSAPDVARVERELLAALNDLAENRATAGDRNVA